MMVTRLHRCVAIQLAAFAVFFSALSGFLPVAHAQTVTTVETLGTPPASQLYSGLGFNINPANEREFQMAANAGAVEVRMQFSWEAVESYDAHCLFRQRMSVLDWSSQLVCSRWSSPHMDRRAKESSR